MSDNPRDDVFEYCSDCKVEHNSKGETREQYQDRLTGKKPSRAAQLQEMLDEMKDRLKNGPEKSTTLNLSYIQEAAINKGNKNTRLAQQAITMYTTELGTVRTPEGESKLEIGDVIAGLARVAVDACCSANDSLGENGPASIKALFSALVDECIAFYRENRPVIDKRIEASKKVAESLITSLELSLAVARAEEEHEAKEAERRGDAEKTLAVKATAVAASGQTDAEKEKEMETLLKAFTANKSTKVH